MTAGSGLVHAELSPAAFKASGGPLELLQLWVNLPSRLKVTRPRYKGLQRAELPGVAADDGIAQVQVIAGEWGGAKGPIESVTGNFMSTASLSAGARIAFDTLTDRNVFLYIISGDVRISGRDVAQHTVVELDLAGESVAIEATSGARVVFGHGDPIGEPVASYGPFLMNTADEIRRAIADYQAGRMGAIAG
jgi:redox-sensitive bicupin YhaK (pirin superfamily)